MSKRRQQRNKQSKGNKRSKEILVKALVSSVILLIVLLIVGYQMTLKFLHSDDFRKQVNEKLSGEIGVPVELGKLKWNGLHLKNESLSAHSDGALVKIEASDIELDVDTSFLKREVWKISDVLVQTADLELDLRKEFTRIELPEKEQSWLEKLLPAKADLLNAQVLRANALIKTEGGEYSVKRVKLEAKQQGDNYEISMSDGELTMPFPVLNEAQLEIAKFRFINQRLVIDQAKMAVFDNGRLELDGEVDFEEQNYSLYGVLSGLKCSDIITEDWKQRLSGDVDATFIVKPKKNNEPEYKGNIKITDGQLTALPVLDLIAAYTVVRDFKTLKFSEFKCDFYKYGQLLQLKNIYVHCDGLMRIEGQLDIRGEQLAGKFKVGLNPGTLSNIPGAEDKVFLPGKEGMHWATVNISGTLDEIKEDLSERLKAAALERMFEMVGGEQVLRFTNQAIDTIGGIPEVLDPSTITDIIKDSGSQLLQGETIEEPIKAGTDLIQSGLNGLFGAPKRPKDTEK